MKGRWLAFVFQRTIVLMKSHACEMDHSESACLSRTRRLPSGSVALV